MAGHLVGRYRGVHVDLLALAENLHIVDVWKYGNETGWVTPSILYDAAQGWAPHLGNVDYWMLHGTAGTNTLAYWGSGSTAVSGNWTLAHYLVPHEHTQYRNGVVHDTTNVVFKMAPPGRACNHAGICAGGVNNTNSIGVEHENMQDGSEVVSDTQLAKSALLYANAAVAQGIMDWQMVLH